MSKREMRRDVYDSGCGWEDCPICGPLIEAEKEIAHRKAVTWPRRDAVGDWQVSEQVGQIQHAQALRTSARRCRRESEKRVRVKRLLTPAQVAEVQEILAGRPFRNRLCSRDEWLSEVWLELLNPTILVARSEGGRGGRRGRPLGLARRVEKAIQRAQWNMRLQRRSDKRLVCVGNVST